VEERHLLYGWLCGVKWRARRKKGVYMRKTLIVVDIETGYSALKSPFQRNLPLGQQKYLFQKANTRGISLRLQSLSSGSQQSHSMATRSIMIENGAGKSRGIEISWSMGP
jgi:hypothetical protein